MTATLEWPRLVRAVAAHFHAPRPAMSGYVSDLLPGCGPVWHEAIISVTLMADDTHPARTFTIFARFTGERYELVYGEGGEYGMAMEAQVGQGDT
jgi:hypothetical protein